MATSPVRFGISVGGFSGEVPGREALIELARKAEAVGFDSVQVGDHIQWHAPILEATALMATFALVICAFCPAMDDSSSAAEDTV